MLSPEAFIGEYKGYSGNTRYQMDLEYLGKLCVLIAEKYNNKQWKKDL